MEFSLKTFLDTNPQNYFNMYKIKIVSVAESLVGVTYKLLYSKFKKN